MCFIVCKSCDSYRARDSDKKLQWLISLQCAETEKKFIHKQWAFLFSNVKLKVHDVITTLHLSLLQHCLPNPSPPFLKHSHFWGTSRQENAPSQFKTRSEGKKYGHMPKQQKQGDFLWSCTYCNSAASHHQSFLQIRFPPGIPISAEDSKPQKPTLVFLQAIVGGWHGGRKQ